LKISFCIFPFVVVVVVVVVVVAVVVVAACFLFLFVTAQKAWIALEASETPYAMEQISLYGPNGKPDWFWKLNPKGTVPTLVCPDGTVFTDSEDILNGIIDSSGSGGSIMNTGSIVPTDEASRARDKAFRSKLSEFLPVGKSTILGRGGGSPREVKMWQIVKELDDLIVGPYVCGEQITTADCAGFPFLWRLETEYGPVDGHGGGCEKVRSWLETCQRNEAFSKTIQKSWWWWW
jgi:glutathione S-transferase